jgi:hypothetical protein
LFVAPPPRVWRWAVRGSTAFSQAASLCCPSRSGSRLRSVRPPALLGPLSLLLLLFPSCPHCCGSLTLRDSSGETHAHGRTQPFSFHSAQVSWQLWSRVGVHCSLLPCSRAGFAARPHRCSASALCAAIMASTNPELAKRSADVLARLTGNAQRERGAETWRVGESEASGSATSKVLTVLLLHSLPLRRQHRSRDHPAWHMQEVSRAQIKLREWRRAARELTPLHLFGFSPLVVLQIPFVCGDGQMRWRRSFNVSMHQPHQI